MLLGFSTSALALNLNAKDALKTIKQTGCLAVELGFQKEWINNAWIDESAKEDLDGFLYLSLHSPKMQYRDDEATRKIFQQIEKIHKIHRLDTVVFHPDNIVDIAVFKKVNFPVGFENMDSQKPFGKTVADLNELLGANPAFRFILDFNHVKSNDPTMKLAESFYAAFGTRISHYHVSGLGPTKPHHVALYQTGQLEIVEAIKHIDAPIICESVVTPDTIKIEKEFIEKHLTK